MSHSRTYNVKCLLNIKHKGMAKSKCREARAKILKHTTHHWSEGENSAHHPPQLMESYREARADSQAFYTSLG